MAAGGPAWSLNGEDHGERFASIHHLPGGRQAVKTMAGIERGPHKSLDLALAAIERHTRGVCRREPSEDQTLDSAHSAD